MSLIIIEHKLQCRLKRLLSLVRELADENTRLRQKEQVMLSLLQDQVDSLYRLGCLTLPTLTGEWSTPEHDDAVLQAAAADINAYELLQHAGHVNSCLPATDCSDSSPGSTTNTQRLRAAVTPDAVIAVQSASTQDLALRLQHSTRRLMLLPASTQPADTHTADSLECAVEEYGRFCMSLHVAAHRQCMELCCLNLDTLQPETPPTGFWAAVAAQVGLASEQVERLTVAFQVYQDKRLPLVAEAQRTVQRLQQLQGHADAELATANLVDARAAVAAAVATTAAGRARPAERAAGQLHQLLERGSSAQGSSCHAPNACAVASCTISLQERSCTAAVGSCPWDTDVSGQVDQLLGQLLSLTKRIRELARHVTMHWVNTLTTGQMAMSITSSYPFWLQPVLVCEVLWRQQQQ